MSFDKILIANRGEIACRIIDTCRRLGVATVAVYSDADEGARHATRADAAVRLGPALAAESYLRGDAIIAAAQATGAQAIHPGYGFLSENPEFAQAVIDAGLTWIGPPPAAIRAMGLKDAAKAAMAEAGVPVVPGYHGEDQDDVQLAREADAIGYPVLIKAVAGGGGKGMRLVETPDGFADALAAARSEARAAFGNPDVLVEKFVENPRHIEVQVFGDSHGGAVHLFERDCSLQRRHQKVIEEAPAPGMTEPVRTAMGQAAVRAAQAIGYAGAGTVEFIVDGTGPLREDGFWFMEMNTRLQVEHPVTEAITGVDLVEWQLRVAAGEPLPLAQGDIAITGHAFEARIYAEDVAAGFLPATGTLARLRFPPGARADTGVREGDTITPYYDPMISKLITHGADRDQALGRLAAALDATQVAGTVTNLAFLSALARHPGFAAGQVDTGLIARDLATLTAAPVHDGALVALAAAAMGGFEHVLRGTGDGPGGFAPWVPLERRMAMVCAGVDYDPVVTVERDTLRVAVGSATHHLRYSGGWIIDGMRPGVTVENLGDAVAIFGAGTHHFTPRDPYKAGFEAAGEGTLSAPMPGLVKALRVAQGAEVTEGTVIAVLEAMKMEHQMRAPFDGRVAELSVSEGDQVAHGAAIARVEPADG